MSCRAHPVPVPERREPSLRVSDAEREAVVQALRAHAGEGRLEPEELEDRVGAALAARTAGELGVLLDDLPAARPARGASRGSSGAREHVAAFVAVHLVMVAIWALSGFGYFWVIWPMLGWGIGLLAHASCARRPRRRPVASANSLDRAPAT